MDALEAIAQRRSVKHLSEPAPGPDELDALLGAAMAAPDHRAHRPWRFFILRGEAKRSFGDVLLASYLEDCARDGRTPTEEGKQKELAKLERAPLVIVTCAVFADDPKAPRDEQLMAAACAVQNLLIAATALGYGTMWRTGEAARSTLVKSALGIRESDEIVGFIYIGTNPDRETAAPLRPAPFDYVEEWSP